MRRFLFALVFLAVSVTFVDAGPFGRRGGGRSQGDRQIPSGPPYQAVDASGSVEALAEVNAKRARLGLRPLIEDPMLTIGAKNVAAFRASVLSFGHCGGNHGDFAGLPAGSPTCVGGCAAYPPSHGWMSCCDDEPQWTYGGAAWCIGSDGKRYMNLFVR